MPGVAIGSAVQQRLTLPIQTPVILNLRIWITGRKKLISPDLDKVDFTPMIEEAKAFTDREQKMIQYVSLNGIFERTHILMGFENALCACMEEPEEFGKMLEAITEHKIRLFKKVFEIAQPDILVYHDDMATQASQFLSTDFYKEYLFPRYKRIVEAAREIGYKYVVQHSCGRIEKIIPDWLECGFDGWDSVMPCNDLYQVKKEFGDKIVFMPGLDTQGVLGKAGSTRQEIEEMVVRWMNMLASDGTGLIIDATVAYSLNPPNEAICLEFNQKARETVYGCEKSWHCICPGAGDLVLFICNGQLQYGTCIEFMLLIHGIQDELRISRSFHNRYGLNRL